MADNYGHKAAYHSRRDLATVSPTMASKKQDMIELLEERVVSNSIDEAREAPKKRFI